MAQQRNEQLNIAGLVEFAAHLFKSYEGKRFDALVDSVRESHVLEPILVRPQGRSLRF